jgi:hypothetical protein
MPFKEKTIVESRLRKDSPSLKFDDAEFEDRENQQEFYSPPKKTFTLHRKGTISPAELNLKLRRLYQIPLSVNRNNITPYLIKIENENHQYFLRRYAINGKEFDVCWMLLQEGI